MRYLKKEFSYRQFPETATDLFAREARFRDYNNSLDQTVDNYNRLKNTQPVEFNLIADELGEIDISLERAEHALNWNSEGIWNYMENLRCTVTDLSYRVTKAQENVAAIKYLVNKWKDKPMFERIDDGKSESLLNIKGSTPAQINGIKSTILCMFFRRHGGNARKKVQVVGCRRQGNKPFGR